MPEYADRDPRELEPHFSKHMSAMTEEDLHSKAAIAEELAYRDRVIERQHAEIDRAWQYIESCLGIPKERGKTLAGALSVLDSRLAKESRVNQMVDADNKRFREALEFYALEDRYDYDVDCCPERNNPGCTDGDQDLLMDRGERARTAIEGSKKDVQPRTKS